MIKLGDSFELLKEIPDKSVDLLLTDPPYEQVGGGSRDTEHWNHKGIYAGNSYMKTEMSSFGRDDIFRFLNMTLPKLKKINAYIFCSRLQLAHYFEYINAHKLKFDLLFWNKAPNGTYMVRTTKVFTNDIEYVIRLYEPYVGLNRFTRPDGKLDSRLYLKNQCVPKVIGDHETTKPVELLSRYIKLSSNREDVVLDPFMGSASTGVAAILNGRRFIGFEKEKRYFDMAERRLETARMQRINEIYEETTVRG